MKYLKKRKTNKKIIWEEHKMKAAILMGSKSDYPIVQKAEEVFKDFGIKFETRIISAHRTPNVAADFAAKAEENGIEVIIAAAGKAAHLAGVIAAFTPLPVIAIPVKSSTLDGLDSLLSMVQMPKGIPVATVAIDGAENAALLAVQILGVKYAELRDAMKKYKAKMEKDVIEADMEFQKGNRG
jgi:5-(carboxyamino)imidazole ribonucleotide mutase